MVDVRKVKGLPAASKAPYVNVQLRPSKQTKTTNKSSAVKDGVATWDVNTRRMFFDYENQVCVRCSASGVMIQACVQHGWVLVLCVWQREKYAPSVWFSVFDDVNWRVDPKLGVAKVPLLPIITAAGDKKKFILDVVPTDGKAKAAGAPPVQLEVSVTFTLAGSTVSAMESGGGIAAVVEDNKESDDVRVSSVDAASGMAKAFYRLAGGDELVSLEVRVVEVVGAFC